MVLLADIVGDDEDAVAKPPRTSCASPTLRGGEGFIAVSAEARKKFWLDRARTAAIATHTNAFKINEDVVIPLPRLGDYCDGIERINIELSITNKLKLLDALDEFFAGELPLLPGRRQRRRRRTARQPARKRASAAAPTVRKRWQWLLDNLDAAADSLSSG